MYFLFRKRLSFLFTFNIKNGKIRVQVTVLKLIEVESMFNKDFIFGCATAASQIEGAYLDDGKVPSIWDKFCEKENAIIDGSDIKIACNSYYKYKEDISLLKELGVKSYRFSINWCRIINENNEINYKGIEYYKNLAKECLNNGITPCATLYHWDMPQYIFEKGGLLNDDFSDWFSFYVDVFTKNLSDLIKDYITINEPQVIIFLGHRIGNHAPGLSLSNKEILLAIHNLLKAHGKAVKIIRKNVLNSTIGFSPCSRGIVPVNNDIDLYNKCKEYYFSLRNDYEFPNLISIYSDPVFLGDYPNEYYEMFKDILPNITKEDLELINQPIDYCYQNVYSGDYYDLIDNKLTKLPFPYSYPEGNINWLQVVPESLYYIPKFLYERYHHPIIISENGNCCHDSISLDGKVHDPNRIDFIHRYLNELEKASNEVDIRGYYYWSLLDNFEWAEGYSKRFGLIYVDFKTLKRTKKDSFYEYQKIIKEVK